MIVRLKIINSEITSAVLEDQNKNVVGSLPFEKDYFEWKNKWFVHINYEGLECNSQGLTKNGKLNRVTYQISYNGVAVSELHSDNHKKTLRYGRIFSNPGSFNGILNLIWNDNGHRWAEFIPDEYHQFLAGRCIDWVTGIKPSEFSLTIRGRFIQSKITSGKNYNAWFNRRRGIITDGAIQIESEDFYTELIRTSDDATYLILQKMHTESGKIERVLYLSGYYLDTYIPKPEEYYDPETILV